jgi:hypothetical protein
MNEYEEKLKELVQAAKDSLEPEEYEDFLDSLYAIWECGVEGVD